MRERAARADFMIIFEVGFENVSPLPFVEHDHSIQAFTPKRSHQPLHLRVLPRRLRGDQNQGKDDEGLFLGMPGKYQGVARYRDEGNQGAGQQDPGDDIE